MKKGLIINQRFNFAYGTKLSEILSIWTSKIRIPGQSTYANVTNPVFVKLNKIKLRFFL